MAWFKIDDHLYSHPKWMALPKPARALWVTAGSWCAGQLLDGTRAEARRLVEAGLWEEIENGYLFHDWAEYQPVRQAVMDKRAKDAERLRKWREQRDAERGE